MNESIQGVLWPVDGEIFHKYPCASGVDELDATNSFQNNDAYLEAWITHAQSLKPGCKMPDITQYDGVHLRALVAYLRQLQ